MDSPSRPYHDYYLLRSVNESTYSVIISGYKTVKRRGIRALWGLTSAYEIYDFLYGVAKEEVIRISKRHVVMGIWGTCAYGCSAIVPNFTIAPGVLKIANYTHSVTSYCFEKAEDCSNVCWLPMDMLLFGQRIPIGDPGRFNLMSGDGSLVEDLLMTPFIQGD